MPKHHPVQGKFSLEMFQARHQPKEALRMIQGVRQLEDINGLIKRRNNMLEAVHLEFQRPMIAL